MACPSLRGALAAAVGIGLYFAPGACPGPPPAVEPVLWVADRDAGQVVGLDRSLLPQVRYAVPWPVQLASAGPRALWVLSRPPAGVPQLCLLLPGQASARCLEFTALHDLAAQPDGCGVVVGAFPDEPAGLYQISRAPGAKLLAALPGARRVAQQDSRTLVADLDGGLRLFEIERDTAVLCATTSLPWPAAELAAAGAGEWWVRVVGKQPRVALLSATLSMLWDRSLPGGVAPGAAPGLCALRGRERGLWIAAEVEGRLCLLTPDGALHPLQGGLPGSALSAMGTSFAGQLFAASLGAVHALSSPLPMRCQGGFSGVVDLLVRGARSSESTL